MKRRIGFQRPTPEGASAGADGSPMDEPEIPADPVGAQAPPREASLEGYGESSEAEGAKLELVGVRSVGEALDLLLS